MLAGYAIEGGIDAVAFFAGMAYGTHRRRRPPKVDPTTLLSCMSCGAEFGEWGALEKEGDAEYPYWFQSRRCTGCGIGQRRRVST